MAIASDSMTTICSHCGRDIPTVNLQLNQKVSRCGEIVPRKLVDEHFKESHAPKDCSLCSETIEREADLFEHQEVCANRTELCHTCNKNESLVDREGVRRRQVNNSEAYQRSDDGDDSQGEAARRWWTRGTSQRRIIYTIALTGFAMLIGSFFLSRRG
ncbi:uncharacterized protein LOC110035738 [Phalaenopsis equestris]|uniref:uncharacterized protein LOC110035738 n=1 Tax=Phalaenopsis equestris TaxID=78828 RepID=UPI0009E19AEB|nr:uncharacterized protein LOC110035738 [Phalaenopsis equestris]